MISGATTWSELAESIVEAIDGLEKTGPEPIGGSLLLAVGQDFRSIRIAAYEGGHPELVLRLGTLPRTTDQAREDNLPVPHGCIDRAISKAAAGMLSWTKDPETFELVEHQRYSLFLRWPEQDTVLVDPYAYGLWDE